MIGTGMNLGYFGYDEYKDNIDAQIRALRECGFDSMFTGSGFSDADLDQMADSCAKYKLRLESLHAPWGGITCIWDDGDAGEEWVSKLKRDLDKVKRIHASYLTVHCMNVPRYNNNGPIGNRFSERGADRFRKVIEYAAELGIKVGFETVEFAQLELKSLMEWCREKKLTEGCGVVWDIGHWNCYPNGLDFADTFGDLLIGTHTHDNFGNTDPQVITYDDDRHLAPFDGTINWQKVGDQLRRSHFNGTVTLEFGRGSQMPWYQDFPDMLSFLTEMHTRAARIAMLGESK